MMLLVIDAGNSFVKWAYHDGREWLNQSRVELDIFCANSTHFLTCKANPILLSNVAGRRFHDVMTHAMPGTTLRWIKSEPYRCGVSNHYDDPAQLGSDRWAALIAARGITKAPCIIVSVGTALTVDMLSASGVFMGGMIAPGPALMRQSLAQGTDAIQPASGKAVPNPSNTADAVETGVMYAMTGAIERAVSIFEAEQDARATILMTGGAANIVAPFLNRPHQVVDNLVLEGLLVLSREETQK